LDDWTIAQQLDAAFSAESLTAQVYIDINNGQNRTGVQLNDHTFALYQAISDLPQVQVRGLHIYDGHIRDLTVEARKSHSDSDFSPVYPLLQQIDAAGLPKPEIINGGSPSFFPASLREEVFCSPGTTLLWDWGYSTFVGEVGVEWAALLVSRVISKPAPGRITTDLGHKSVGSENPIDKRVKFLNLSDYEPVGQNEEHLILTVKDWDAIHIGDVLYGVPYHVCPSVALHDEAKVIRDNEWVETWSVSARTRKITI
jgi:D-serine deaminase-like pyridoxal phosphate-dependent protein